MNIISAVARMGNHLIYSYGVSDMSVDKTCGQVINSIGVLIKILKQKNPSLKLVDVILDGNAGDNRQSLFFPGRKYKHDPKV